MSAQQTPCPRFLVMAGSDPKDKGIHDSQWGHYGVTFATVSFAYEYSHMPEYGAKMAAEYAERVAAALNACEGIPIEVLKANAAGGLPYSVADQIDARAQRDELLAACKCLLDDMGKPDDGAEANLMARCRSAIAKVNGEVPHQGMTIAGDGASMLGKLMREQHTSRGGVYPDGNPNAGSTP